MLDASQAKLIVQSTDEELTHTSFVEHCATVDLPTTFTFDIGDPMSEACLKTARWDSNQESKHMVQCIDVFCKLKVPRDAVQRQRILRQQLEVFKQECHEKTGAWQRPAVTAENIRYFHDLGLERIDAECCVWALSFYTGEGSALANRGASLMIRKGNAILSDSRNELKAQELIAKTNMIVYYMTLAMRHIPFYWGQVTRFVSLTEEAFLEFYLPGNIVTWLQWASSRKGEKGASAFKGRNAKFVIWSVKGRHIDQFSNFSTRFGHDEDEVLFLPFTRLLILKVVDHGSKSSPRYEIHCRELELAITQGMPLLWVDDEIWQEDFEMKGHLESAQLQSKQEIKFVLKQSTSLAMSYLDSCFGRFHLGGQAAHALRIMTDMTRMNDEGGPKAGAYFIKLLEKHMFSGYLMVFTSDSSKAVASLIAVGVTTPIIVVQSKNDFKKGFVMVTDIPGPARAFLSFER